MRGFFLNQKKVGADKEQLAANYLERNGMRIVERNFRARQGEIDIIGYHRGYLVFVQVKFRKSVRMGNALEAVGLTKQKTICRVADHYRALHRLGDHTMVRYDVVAIQGDEIIWVQNAFPHILRGHA